MGIIGPIAIGEILKGFTYVWENKDKEQIMGMIKDSTAEENIDFDFMNLNKEIFFVNNAKDIGLEYSENRLVDFYNNINANISTKDIRKLALLRMIYTRLPNIDKSSSLLMESTFNDTERDIISSYLENIVRAFFTGKLYFRNSVFNNQIDFLKSLN